MVEIRDVVIVVLPIIIAFFGLRIAFFRRRILELQTHVRGEIDTTNTEFEDILNERRRADRDPMRALNTAERLFTMRRIEIRLSVFYRNNKIFEILALAAIGVSIPFAIIGYEKSVGEFSNTALQIHSLITTYTVGLTVLFFVGDLFSINRYEKRLGIGQILSRGQRRTNR